eukprot:6195230-Pleurochrysis_carterae.AAC.2
MTSHSQTGSISMVDRADWRSRACEGGSARVAGEYACVDACVESGGGGGGGGVCAYGVRARY